MSLSSVRGIHEVERQLTGNRTQISQPSWVAKQIDLHFGQISRVLHHQEVGTGLAHLYRGIDDRHDSMGGGDGRRLRNDYGYFASYSSVRRHLSRLSP